MLQFLSPKFGIFRRSKFKWHIEFFNGRMICGWIGCLSAPQLPCVVSFLQGSQVLTVSLADAPRPDVSLLGFGATGFSCDFGQWVDGPIVFSAFNPAIRGWVVIDAQFKKQLGCGFIDDQRFDLIRGWAASFEEGTEKGVEVILWAGLHRIASVATSLQRPDVASVMHLKHARVGFELRLPFRAIVSENSPLQLIGKTRNGEFLIMKDLNLANCEPSFSRTLRFDVPSTTWK